MLFQLQVVVYFYLKYASLGIVPLFYEGLLVLLDVVFDLLGEALQFLHFRQSLFEHAVYQPRHYSVRLTVEQAGPRKCYAALSVLILNELSKSFKFLYL